MTGTDTKYSTDYSMNGMSDTALLTSSTPPSSLLKLTDTWKPWNLRRY